MPPSPASDQLDAHIASAVEDNIRRGMTPEAPRREALMKLGSRDLARELHSEARGLPFLETLPAMYVLLVDIKLQPLIG
jgi:hypothetical protein